MVLNRVLKNFQIHWNYKLRRRMLVFILGLAFCNIGYISFLQFGVIRENIEVETELLMNIKSFITTGVLIGIFYFCVLPQEILRWMTPVSTSTTAANIIPKSLKRSYFEEFIYWASMFFILYNGSLVGSEVINTLINEIAGFKEFVSDGGGGIPLSGLVLMGFLFTVGEVLLLRHKLASGLGRITCTIISLMILALAFYIFFMSGSELVFHLMNVSLIGWLAISDDLNKMYQ